MTTNSTARSDSALGDHTPLPWQALAPDEVDVFVPIIGVRLDENGDPLETPTNGLVGGATLFPTEIDAEDYKRAEANAAFIVRAANSHYDLLEALTEAEWFLAHYADYVASVPVDEIERHPYLPDLQEKLEMLRAAIAKATPQNHLQHKGIARD